MCDQDKPEVDENTFKDERIERQEIYCHGCKNTFIAEIDMAISGEYIIECPCGHEHCRTIKDGVVTEARWDSNNGPNSIRVSGRSVWKSGMVNARTSTTSHWLREAWLNRLDIARG